MITTANLSGEPAAAQRLLRRDVRERNVNDCRSRGCAMLCRFRRASPLESESRESRLNLAAERVEVVRNARCVFDLGLA